MHYALCIVHQGCAGSKCGAVEEWKHPLPIWHVAQDASTVWQFTQAMLVLGLEYAAAKEGSDISLEFQIL